MSVEIEFLTTTQLIQELLKRSDHAAIVLMRCGQMGGKETVYIRNWTGNPHTAMGLCDDLRDHILKKLRAEEQSCSMEGT